MLPSIWTRPHAPSGRNKDAIVERALANLCAFPKPDAKGHRQRLPREQFTYITGMLRHLDTSQNRIGDQKWAHRPRIYSVLFNINAMDLMDKFVEQQIRDIELPYDPHNLPGFLKDHLMCGPFLKEQECVLTDAKHLEDSMEHVNFAEDADEHMIAIRRLGRGACGWVEEVSCKLSGRSYARKKVLQSNSWGNLSKSRKAQQMIIQEIETMKKLSRKLSYKHLTRIVNSYSDPKTIGFLMEPVADDNLYTFLSNKRSTLILGVSDTMRQFFGCLAGALDYLHGHNIRHRDLKPENILIKDGCVYLADFGAAYDWSKSNRQTTQDMNVPYTENYMAPEVATIGGLRKASSDLWSLGIVFLEIATVIKGYKLSRWNAYRKKRAAVAQIDQAPCHNLKAVNDWMAKLRDKRVSRPMDNEPLGWIDSLLQPKPEKRPDARSLVRTIRESIHFEEFCCDHCIHRFEDPEFFYNDPRSWTQFSDPQTIDRQIGSMDRETDETQADSSRHSTVLEWMSLTQEPQESNASIRENLRQSDLEPRQTGDSSKLLHESGCFFVSNDSDSDSDDDTDTDENDDSSDDDDGGGGASGDGAMDFVSLIPHQEGERMPRLYNVINDTSSDEVESLRSEDEESILEPEDPLLLTTIMEQEHENDHHGAGEVTETCSVPNFHWQFTGSRDGSEFVHGHAYEEQAQQWKLGPTFEVDQDESRIRRDSLVTRQLQSIPTEIPICGTETLTEHEGQVHETTTERSRDEICGVPNLSGEGIPPGLSRPRRTLDTMSLPDAMTAVASKPASPTTSTFTTGRRSSFPSIVSLDDNVESSEARATQIHIPIGEMPLPRTPAAIVPTIAPSIPSIVDPVHSQPLQTDEQPTDPAGVSLDSDFSTFDPLEYIEQTFKNVAGTKSRATTAMTEGTLQTMAKVSNWIDGKNKYLEHFCQKGHTAAVKKLLSRNSNPGTSLKPRPQPIALAVQGASQRHNKCVKALINAGCDVNKRYRSVAPIHRAIQNPYFDGYLDLIGMLLQAGAEMSRPDHLREYPLTKLFAGPLDIPLEEHQIKALALVLHKSVLESTGVDVNVRHPASGNTALHMAVQRRTPYAVKLLIYRGTDVNAKNASGTTPLLVAASQWQIELSQPQKTTLAYLLEAQDLKVDATGGSFDRSALHQAARAGCFEAVDMLLDRDADIQLRDRLGKTALSLCRKAENTASSKQKAQYSRVISILEDRTS